MIEPSSKINISDFWRFVNQKFCLEFWAQGIKDKRLQPQIPLSTIFLSMILMGTLGTGSFLGIDGILRRKSAKVVLRSKENNGFKMMNAQCQTKHRFFHHNQNGTMRLMLILFICYILLQAGDRNFVFWGRLEIYPTYPPGDFTPHFLALKECFFSHLPSGKYYTLSNHSSQEKS